MFELFEIDTNISPLASRWENYRYKDFCLGFDIKDPVRKKALLIHSAGVGVKWDPQHFNKDPSSGNETVYTSTEKARNDYFIPKKNFE